MYSDSRVVQVFWNGDSGSEYCSSYEIIVFCSPTCYTLM